MRTTPFSVPASAFAVPAPLLIERIDIVEATIRVLRRHDHHDADHELVALEAGLPLAAVTRQFPSWDGLVIATMERWMSGRQDRLWEVALSHGAIAFLRELVRVQLQDPALVRLQLALLIEGSRPSHPGNAFIRQQYLTLLGYLQHALSLDVAANREPATMQPARGAEQLLALHQGLQLQWMMRDFDLLEAHDRAITRLRHSWAEEHTAPDLGWIL